METDPAFEREEFWSSNQPGFKFTDETPGTSAFYREVERHRYTLEPHIPEVVRFHEWTARDVLDVGCGVATDGARFAHAGARYTGFDSSPQAIALARRRFELEDLNGDFQTGDATRLPFEDRSFDLVYSHGVIHHFPDTEKAVAEFHRVLRPGGTALVMLYHRASLNYHFTIMFIRRALAATLLIPGAARAIAKLTGEDQAVLEGHQELLSAHGVRYLTDRQRFLSNNTDGPGNPLSKVYDEREARELFRSWRHVETTVRYLNLRIFPKGQQLARSELAESLGRRWGWHLYVHAER